MIVQRRPCWAVLAAALAACGGNRDLGKPVPASGPVLDEATVEVSADLEQTVELGEGPQRTLLQVPAQASAQRGPVTVRVEQATNRRGATPANGTVLHVATQAVIFSPAARMRQAAPPAPAGRAYVAVHSPSDGEVWAQRAYARVASEPAAGMQEFEIDVHGSGLWAIALVETIIVDGGAPEPPGSSDGGAPMGTPQLLSLTPSSGLAGSAVSIALAAKDLAADAVVVFGGQKVTAVREAAGTLRAEVSAALTMQAGQHPVWIENLGPGAKARSNVLYYVATGAATGAPVIVDYNPDNGMAGDRVLLVGTDLAGENVTITDPRGATAAAGGVGSTSWWGNELQTLEFVLPQGWQTGPITISHAKGSFRGKTFNVGRNLARAPGTVASASSEFGGGWTIPRGSDNDLVTSWFTLNNDCVSAPTCTSVPWYKLTFATPQTVSRIAVRGNREYMSGYDFVRAKLEIVALDGGVLWSGSYELPEPDRDLDLVLPTPVANAGIVKFTSLQDESVEPGFAELEVF